jgi:hypothetical protein
MSSDQSRIFDGRYLLDVQITSSLSSPIWRAKDELLKRWVTLILLPTSDLRSVKLLQECQAAAVNDRRDVVSILDVIPAGKIATSQGNVGEDKFVGIVTEWLDGETLDRLLIKRGEVFSIEQAIKQTKTIANTLMNAHSLGIFHRRLRPHNVIFSPGQEVRLSGFGVDSALLGSDSNDDQAQDIKGVGQLLFAMTTGMWPLGNVDSLPAAIGNSSGLVLPSQVHEGVKPYIDRIYQQTQNDSFTSMREVIEALSVSEFEESESLQRRVTRLTASSVTWTPPRNSKSGRVRATLIAGLSVFVFGWIGFQLLSNGFQSSDSSIAALESPLPSAEATQEPVETSKAMIASIVPYDPFGDQVENPELAQFAIDGLSDTRWQTVIYRDASMGKTGVGLLLDLGQTYEVYSVEIDFGGVGHSAEVYVGNSAEIDFATARKFGDSDPAKANAQIGAGQAASGRYVLVWLTPELPLISDGRWQGGIAEIRVMV